MPEPIVAYWEALPIWITFGLAVLAALLLAMAIWWRLPKREAARLALKIRDAKARVDVEDTYRKTVGQALGGIVVLLGAGFAYLQFSGQQQSAHDLLISNQVSKGFEQLGSDKVVVRLGGIYALEGVMNTSRQYHIAVLDALCAFVREGAKLPTRPPAWPGPLTHEPPTDRRRPERRQPDLRRPEPRLPGQRPPVQRRPNRRFPNQRHSARRPSDRSQSERRSPGLCRPERRRPDSRQAPQRRPELRLPDRREDRTEPIGRGVWVGREVASGANSEAVPAEKSAASATLIRDEASRSEGPAPSALASW
jgi:hypothetical protein